MNFLEALTFGGIIATILGVFLTLYAIINNKTLKAEAKNISELITEFRREHAETMRIMMERLDDFRREHAETMRMMAEKINEFRKSHEETIKYIANLIVTNGERTRQEIRRKKAKH
ncbi:MAG: hypothetical protein RMJ81_03165 [Candidatus Kryptonium sp.]|nr:hypothetical protein [Candidatus Kryptonium sp.]MCX7762750.1 hypothetical protein [Candidatus Kryptonium sp.]MDW8108638.1 hypothetical protein [Candidatus Kryptonium sp.]